MSLKDIILYLFSAEILFLPVGSFLYL